MVCQVRCVETFIGDAFGSGNLEKFTEGRVYALPSRFLEINKQFFETTDQRETKPLREAIEIKSNNGTSKRARNARRAKTQS